LLVQKREEVEEVDITLSKHPADQRDSPALHGVRVDSL
jgi:hypothetical protein